MPINSQNKSKERLNCSKASSSDFVPFITSGCFFALNIFFNNSIETFFVCSLSILENI